MIAVFHGIETDQDQVAELSSEMSASNQGTWRHAARHGKTGLDGRVLNWKDADDLLGHAYRFAGLSTRQDLSIFRFGQMSSETWGMAA